LKHSCLKKIITVSMVFVLTFTLLTFTSCESETHDTELMSFEFTLTDQDVEEALALTEQLEVYIEEENNSKIVSTAKLLQDKRDYIVHQSLVGKINYYSDLEDDQAYGTYASAEDANYTVREESLRVLKKLYRSDLPAKDKVFEDWTEAEIKTLEVSDEDIAAIEKQQDELLQEYLALDNTDPETWSTAQEEIYLEFVHSGQQLAFLYGHDNYYNYAANEIYNRVYSKDQRESFRESVKEQILPLYLEVEALYQEKRDRLTEDQEALFSSLRKDTCLQSNEYLAGYIESYPEEMKTIMNYIFDREAVVYSESENAYGIAYTNYSNYCDQPFVFLGNGCQDLLTFVHELGHYVSFYHFADDELPYDTCEVQSQGGEWLLLNYLDGKLDAEVYEAFLLWRLRYGLDIITLSTLVDEFEEEVYTRAELASPDEFESILEDVVDSYEGIEELYSIDELYTYAQRVSIEVPVYYLSYATSEVASMSFYAVANEEGYEIAQDIYIDLCLKTPTDRTFSDTLMDVGLPDPFEEENIVKIKETFENVFEAE